MVRSLVLVVLVFLHVTALYLLCLAREHVREPPVLIQLHCVLPHAILPNLYTLPP